ncbi:histidine--tRNA ligase [Massilibacterium senegalense]|uniref:histidine--tRNA ligase n=1 Tax=Massilibacterium senegalense TaxID=1632858 RepID=UPI000780E1B0|nr:histidine--tRNA ligase [Massilibacterium senegalense]
MSIQIPRGTQDILPEQSKQWQYIEQFSRNMCGAYQYHEIRTPIFEHTELFSRGVGDTTDIVQKEMYTFEDRGGRSLTLRPEGTAAVVRAFVEKKLYGLPDQPTKLYYTGPMFRYERQQKGRYRQFVQFGVEALGSQDPAIDAEVISLAMNTFKGLGLQELVLKINSLGDTESRLAHRQALINHFQPHIHEFCEDCKGRLEKNPLRILDCKVDHKHPLMQTAPSILDYLNEESKRYFEKVLGYLDVLGIEYEVDSTLVRGLDYYNHTAFEIMSKARGFGSITTLCGGGRYNGLVEDLGGPETPGIGYAFSIERILLALEAEKQTLPVMQKMDAYIIALGEEATEKAVKILQTMRLAGISCDKDYQQKKMKAQFKQADRLQATFVIVIGEEELQKEKAVVKKLATGEQTEVAFADLLSYMKQAKEEKE